MSACSWSHCRRVYALLLCGLWQTASLYSVSAAPPAEQGRDPAPRTVVIHDVSVLDWSTGGWKTGQSILIQGERIAAIAPPGELPAVPPAAEVVSGTGKYVIPGLIDAHVHLVHRIDFGHATGDEILPLFLAAGVTGVRDTGDEIVAETVVSHYADSHPAMCPRVFLCSGLLDGDPVIHKDVGIPIRDPEQVPKILADMAAWNVTTVKIYAGSRRPVGRRIIEAAHEHGKFVTAHLSRYPAQEAIEDGVDGLEHITTVFDFMLPEPQRYQRDQRIKLDFKSPLAAQLVQLLAEKKVWVDPTLIVFRNMLLLSDDPAYHAHPDNARVPRRIRRHWDDYRGTQRHKPETQAARRQEFQKYLELVGVLHRGGVRLLIGTDTAEPYCPPGLSLHQEMEMYRECGIPPLEILRMATRNNAAAVRRERDLGSVEAGKIADLVILEADPLIDIRHTRKVWRVVRSGYVNTPAALLQHVPQE